MNVQDYIERQKALRAEWDERAARNALCLREIKDARESGWNVEQAWLLGRAEARVARLAKVAKKLGLPEPALQIGKSWTFEQHDSGRTTVETMTAIRLIGEPPILPGGWRLLARVEDIEGARMVFAVPGAPPMPDRAWYEAHVCDHCNKKRARAKTYIVQDEQGVTKRIGANCLIDFLGHRISLHLYQPSLDGLAEDSEPRGRHNPRVASTETILAHSSAAIRVDGCYRKPSEYGGDTTRSIVSLFFNDDRGCDDQERRRRNELRLKYAPTDADVERARTVLDWMLALDTRPSPSDYERNLHAVAVAGTVVWKTFGVTCSAPAAWDRAHAAPKPARAAAEPAENPIWSPEGRSRVAGEAVSIKLMPGYAYNSPDVKKALVRVAASNDVYKVWVTVPAGEDCSRGDHVEFDCTLTRKEIGFSIGKRPAKWVTKEATQ